MTPKYSLIVFKGMSNDHPGGGARYNTRDRDTHITRLGITFYFTNSPNCKFLVMGLGGSIFLQRCSSLGNFAPFPFSNLCKNVSTGNCRPTELKVRGSTLDKQYMFV